MSDVGFSRAGIAAAVAVPLVAIGGLALLSPLALGRKRRDLDSVEGNRNTIASYARKGFSNIGLNWTGDKREPDAVDRLRSRVTDIYTDVVTSDECLERLVCELGSAAKNIYYKDSVLRYVINLILYWGRSHPNPFFPDRF